MWREIGSRAHSETSLICLVDRYMDSARTLIRTNNRTGFFWDFSLCVTSILSEFLPWRQSLISDVVNGCCRYNLPLCPSLEANFCRGPSFLMAGGWQLFPLLFLLRSSLRVGLLSFRLGFALGLYYPIWRSFYTGPAIYWYRFRDRNANRNLCLVKCYKVPDTAIMYAANFVHQLFKE